MKQIVFAVDEKKSYVRDLGWPTVKPKVPLPLQVPLEPGGSLILTVDEQKGVLNGGGSNLRFTTDKLEKTVAYYISGGMQTIHVMLSSLDLSFNAQTGKITQGGGFTQVYGSSPAGAGALALWYLGPSKLVDGNSPGFNLANGLGCGGGIELEVGCGNPTDFVIHLEALVSKEDADGDGKFEVACPVGIWKTFRLEYDPPKIRIVVPNRNLFNPLNPGAASMQAIRLGSLLRLAKKSRAGTTKTLGIERIEFSQAQDIWVVGFDAAGRVYGGEVSDKAFKVLPLPREHDGEVMIGVVPQLGVGLS